MPDKVLHLAHGDNVLVAVAPVIKITTNSATATRMSDIIDFDADTIVTGEETIQESA
jgi:altronate dehydratase